MQSRYPTAIALVALIGAVLASCSGGDDEPLFGASTTEAASTTAAASTTSQPDIVAGGPLRLSLTAVDGGPGTVLVQVTVTNVSDGPLTVVRPFVTRQFVVFRLVGPDGREIPFDGPYLRLEPLTTDDVAELAPGASVSSQFDLTEHFVVPTGSVTLSAEYRARQVHHGGLAMTVDPEDPVVAEPIVIEVLQ